MNWFDVIMLFTVGCGRSNSLPNDTGVQVIELISRGLACSVAWWLSGFGWSWLPFNHFSYLYKTYIVYGFDWRLVLVGIVGLVAWVLFSKVLYVVVGLVFSYTMVGVLNVVDWCLALKRS